MIRYRSKDVSRLYAALSCDCGRTHRRYGQIKARTDDMLKISGVNFWPSEVESVILKEADLGPEYRIIVSRSNAVDRMQIEIESRERIQSPESRKSLADRLAKELHNILLFSPEVTIVEPNSLPRTEVGKAMRVVDERKGSAS